MDLSPIGMQSNSCSGAHLLLVTTPLGKMHGRADELALVPRKRCNRCGEEKLKSEYRPSSGMPCAECCREREKEERFAKKVRVKSLEDKVHELEKKDRERDELVHQLTRNVCRLMEEYLESRKKCHELRKENRRLKNQDG
jgi:hypothetical protein